MTSNEIDKMLAVLWKAELYFHGVSAKARRAHLEGKSMSQDECDQMRLAGWNHEDARRLRGRIEKWRKSISKKLAENPNADTPLSEGS